MNIKNNIEKFTQSLPKNCKLIAVSKNQSVEKVKQAYDAGQRRFGENKAQELVAKVGALPTDIEWHMIGHLQSNKVKLIASFVHLIHSIDSLKLLEEVDKQGHKTSRVINCLLQIHIANEETKFGFSEDEVLVLLQQDAFKNLKSIKVVGLMGMATLTEDTNQIRQEFHGLQQLFKKIKTSISLPNIEMSEISMGMSSDNSIAVEEGSTMVRVGTAIFGERTYT